MLEWIYWLIRDALFFFGMVSGGLIRTLPRKERMVIEMRYGMLDGKAHPQHEVATALGISRSYISRIEKRAVETLRRGMR